MNRLLLYVHFNKHGQISEHVNYQLEKLRPLFSRVVLISNSPLSIDSQKALTERGLMDDFVQRENEGFDFAAWRDGMDVLGFDQLADYDSVTLMNDTCFGPLWDLEPIYQGFEENLSVDFWGMTNH
ncbi:alpha-L-Rha alpha-1,3-L-rhamnosyltransferase, partial [Rhizobium leguminosarum]|uniref:rhamnan synthesis F family protein n=1 Tax=Rhizobium leguminosarum TaxID=384 RepID=UPI0014062ED3